MGMQATVRRAVVQSKNGAILDVWHLGQLVPRTGSVDWLAVDVQGLSLVLEDPDVVIVLVGVQSDLLLLGSSWVHQGVRVQIATLGVDVADRNTAAHQHIDRNVLHALGVERGLELRAHEAIAIAGVDEAEKWTPNMAMLESCRG